MAQCRQAPLVVEELVSMGRGVDGEVDRETGVVATRITEEEVLINIKVIISAAIIKKINLQLEYLSAACVNLKHILMLNLL